MARRWFFLFGAAFLALAQEGRSQRASDWRVYKIADGLVEPACISVSVTPRGKVLVRHLSAAMITRLDGYTTTNFPAPAGAVGRVRESPNGQVWSLTLDGLQEWKNGAWLPHPVPEIADEFGAGFASVPHPVPFYPVKQGRVIFLLQNRLMEFNTADPTRSRTLINASALGRIGDFLGMNVARDGGLWISGAGGLARAPGPIRDLEPGVEWRQYYPPESLGVRNFQEPLEDKQGGLTAMAESTSNQSPVIVRFDGARWEVKPAGAEQIRFAWSDTEKVTWVASAESLYQFTGNRPEMTETPDVSARRYFDLAVEPGGAFWLATSDGLYRHAPPAWGSPDPLQKIASSVHGLEEDAEGNLWFVSGGRLCVFRDGSLTEHVLPAATARSSQNGCKLFSLRNGTLLLDTESRGLQLFSDDGELKPFPVADEDQHLKALGRLRDGTVCVQNSGPGKKRQLEIFDGLGLQPVPFPVPPFDDPYTALLVLQNGDVWLGGEHGVACYRDRKWQAFASLDRSTPEGAEGFVELPDGKIWCASGDQIWEFDGRNWSVVRTGFDRIGSLLRSRDGSVWVGSSIGLFRFWQDTWIEIGIEEGLPSAAIQEFYEDQQGHIWVATTRGLCRYFPEADPDPPKTTIRRLADENSRLFEGGTLNLLFNGEDKWKYTTRDRLLYSYRLDQRDWSPFQELNAASFADMVAGKHYFQVRAMDRNGNMESTPAQFEFSVALPWYRETRLVLISLAGLVAALFFAAIAFNRHRQLVRSYAAVEKKVAERTRELEMANRELWHSQKMTALGTLAAGIAHDFNNILSIIKGSAQIIEDNVENPQKIRTRVDRIKTVVEQGSGIVKAMLGFSRDSGGQPGLCDPKGVVDDTIKLLGDRFLREVEVAYEPPANLPEVSASKDFIQQILLNFIFNAAEAMTARKQIVLRARTINSLPAGVMLVPASTATYVSISVQDTSCGIPPGNMPRIFDPFFTTKSLSTHRGTGLGLSMVYELARKMQAGLAVESAVDRGSTFTLLLPVRPLPSPHKTEKAEMTSPSP